MKWPSVDALIFSVPVLFAVFTAIVILHDCFYVSHVYETATIVSVNGCDKYGWCGVVMDDGAWMTLRHPAVGQRRTYEVSK